MDNNPFRSTHENNTFQHGSTGQPYTQSNNPTQYNNPLQSQTTPMTGMRTTSNIHAQSYSPMGISQQPYQQYSNHQNVMQAPPNNGFGTGSHHAQPSFNQPTVTNQVGMPTNPYSTDNTIPFHPQPHTQQQSPYSQQQSLYPQQQQQQFPQPQPFYFAPQLQQQQQQQHHQPQQYNPSNVYIPPDFGLSNAPPPQQQPQQPLQPRHPPVDASTLLKAGKVRKEVCPICHKTIEGDDPAINHHVNEHLE